MKKIVCTSIVANLLSFYLVTKPAKAQLGTLSVPTATNVNTGDVIFRFINLALIIGSLAFLIVFVWGCFEWITSEGDKNNLMRARGRIIYGLIGVLMLGLSWVAMTIISALVYTP